MLFNRIDKDENGLVRVNEVSTTVKELLPAISPLQLAVLEKLIDINNNGNMHNVYIYMHTTI